MSNFLRFCRISSTAAALALAAVSTFAQPHDEPDGHDKLAHDLTQVRSSLTPVVIQYVNPPSASELASITSHGGSIKSQMPLIHAVSATIPSVLLRLLINDSNVLYVTPDRPVGNRGFSDS